MIEQKYNLSLIPNSVMTIVHVSQYDKVSRTITLELYDNEGAYSIPSGCVVIVRGTKRDGTGFEYECTYDGSSVSFNIQQQQTIFDGDVLCELRIFNNEAIIGTQNFIIRVEKTPLGEDVPISETDLPMIEEVFEKIPEIEENARIAQESATQASESATQASNKASEASESASNANTNALKAEGYAVGQQNGEDVPSTSPYYHNNAKYYAQITDYFYIDDEGYGCIDYDLFKER